MITLLHQEVRSRPAVAEAEYGGLPHLEERGSEMVVLRRLIGDVLRRTRLRQERTLREVSSSARVSLGYLSEIERGQKEASSELLSSICGALGVPMSTVLREVADELALSELSAMGLETPPPGLPPAGTAGADAPVTNTVAA